MNLGPELCGVFFWIDLGFVGFCFDMDLNFVEAQLWVGIPGFELCRGGSGTFGLVSAICGYKVRGPSRAWNSQGDRVCACVFVIASTRHAHEHACVR